MENGNHHELLIFTPGVGSRVSYIVDTLFPVVILTDSKEKFLAHTGIRINYSDEKISATELQIVPHGLLTQEGIHEQAIDCFEWEGMKGFFATTGNIPFDIFSASFYLLSRYEEYLPYEADKYGRYPHTDSLAYKEGFLDIPLVNLWMRELRNKLKKLFPNSQFPIPNPQFRFIPTYDLDIAYAYLHQPIWKNVAGFYRDLLLGKFEEVVERGNVYSGRRNDPFDVFDWIDGLHERYQLKPVYFFLTIIKRGEYDKNLSSRSKALQKLYERLAVKYVSGLHPSWQSGTDEWLLEKEVEVLQEIIQKPITS